MAGPRVVTDSSCDLPADLVAELDIDIVPLTIRFGAAQALIGSMLSIKPIIEVRDGQVEPESKQRTRSRALRYLADKVRKEDGIENLAVMHGDAPDLDELIELLEPLVPRDKMVIGDIGAVIGAHAGPRVIGVAYQVGSSPTAS